MSAAKRNKDKPPPGPDDLVREAAGSYRSGDGRFEVTKSDVGWYLVDTEQANELGQQLIHGPMPTLDAARDAVPGAREIKPLLRVRPARESRKARTETKAPPSPPPTWIDRLPDSEAEEVRRLIRALEREGVADAEALVKNHRHDATPTIAMRVVERRLSAIVSGEPDSLRESARAIVAEVARVLTSQGTTVARPLPRWALVELEGDETPPKTIRLQL